MAGIGRNSVITFTAQVLSIILGLASSVMLARMLGPRDRGIFELILLIHAVILRFGTLGLDASSVYFSGRNEFKLKDIVSNALSLSIVFGIILILLFFIISRFGVFINFLSSNSINPLYLWLVILTNPIYLLFYFFNHILLGKEEVKKYNIINIFHTFLFLLFVFIFLYLLNQQIIGGIISYILSIILVTLLLIFYIRKISVIAFGFNKILFRESMKYGLKSHIGNIAQFLNYRLDMFLIAVFLTPTEVGYYIISVSLVEKIFMIPNAIATVLFPRVASLKECDANNITSKVSRHTFIIVLFLSFFIALLSNPFIRILFGSIFLPAVMPLIILLPGVIALSVAKILSSDIAGRGKPQYNTYASIVSLVLNFTLNLYFIPLWGIRGAAFSSTVSYVATFLIVTVVFTKISGKSWLDVLRFNKMDFQDYKEFGLRIRAYIK